MAPAKKKPPVTGYRQASDKGRPTKSTPQKRPTSAMPGPRPKTSTRTSNTTGMVSPKPTAKPKAKPAAKPTAPRGMTMSGDRGAAIKGAGNPAGPRAPKPSWDQKGNLKRPALPAAGQTSGNRTATRIEGMRNRIIANVAAGKPSGVRTGQPANIKGALPAAGKTGGNQANAAVKRAVQGGTGNISLLKTGLAGLALGALSDKYLSPLARKAGTALGKNVVIPAARALDDAMPGINSRDERMRSNSKAAETGNTSKFAGARDKAFAKAKAIKGSPVLGPKKVGSGGGGGKVGTIAQAFDKSFAAARKAGKSEFTFQGKRYNTKMK